MALQPELGEHRKLYKLKELKELYELKTQLFLLPRLLAACLCG
jgi:hypothetical protein